ncbi:MAG: hydrogenase maturation protease [Gemmatimonadota bacterium]
MRTLIAGFGNVLRGDDGFGVEVLRRLEIRGRLHPTTHVLEVGTGGLRLAQELMTGYDRLIIVDALKRGGAPGTVYSLAVEAVEPAREIDMHTAIPSRALAIADALGVTPPEVFLVGCEPLDADELVMSLSPIVSLAADEAAVRIEDLEKSQPGPANGREPTR